MPSPFPRPFLGPLCVSAAFLLGQAAVILGGIASGSLNHDAGILAGLSCAVYLAVSLTAAVAAVHLATRWRPWTGATIGRSGVSLSDLIFLATAIAFEAATLVPETRPLSAVLEGDYTGGRYGLFVGLAAASLVVAVVLAERRVSSSR